MARFLFTVWPFAGHVNPYLSVAKALQARGHTVAFYTGEQGRVRVEDEGFDVFPFRGIDEDRLWRHVEVAEVGASASWNPFPLLRAVFRDWLVGTVPAQVADLQAVIREWQPDALASDPVMWGPPLVLSGLDGPPVAVLSTWIGCPIPGAGTPPWGLGLRPPRNLSARMLSRAITLGNDALAAPLRRQLDAIRGRYGLPPLGMSVNAYMGRMPLYLVPSIPELDYNRRDLPSSVHYVGPCICNKPSREPAPRWLDHLSADHPCVHVTEGTAHYQEPFVLRAAARGLASLPMEVVLTTGPQRDPATLDLGPPAPNVRIERWVSHADILPRCAALVTTGGAGTVMAALQAGVPMVIVPTRWDKPDNAQRVADAGVGLRLDPWRCTPTRLRAAVERLLSEPSFRRNAQRLSRRLAEAPGPVGAAELLEGLADACARAPLHAAPT